MSDENDCCCKECGAPIGKRSGAGKALPSGSGEGTAKMVMCGASSIDATTGEPVARPFRASESGAMVFEELPHGFTGTLVNDNATLIYVNGRLMPNPISGSGGWSQTA